MTAKLAAFITAGLILLGQTAKADPLQYFQTFYGVDYTSAGVAGLRGVPEGGTINLTGVSGTVTKAYLYWQGHGTKNELIDPALPGTATLNGQVVTGQSMGISGPDGWDFAPISLAFGQAFRADVTSLVQANGAYTVNNFFPLGTNVQGASLIVIYDDGTPANNYDVTIYNGDDCNSGFFDAAGWNFTASDILYSGGTATMEVHVSDGQWRYNEGPITLNNNVLTGFGDYFRGMTIVTNTPFDYNFLEGTLWDIKTYDITSFLSVGYNTLTMASEYADEDMSLVVTVFKVPSSGGTPPPPPPVNNPPTISCSGGLIDNCAPATGAAHTVTASVYDVDGNNLTVTWIINGVTVQTDNVVGNGSTPTSTTVSITRTFLPGNNDVSVTVSDGRAAPATCSATLVIVPASAPVVTCPGALSVSLTNLTTTAVPNILGQVTVTGACTYTLTQTPAAGSIVGIGNTVITVTATDVAGNQSSCTTTFTVVQATTTNNSCTYTTFTQGGWGAKPTGNNPGKLLADNFCKVYPTRSVNIGGCYSLTFTSAAAIEAFLPQSGTACALKRSYTNPGCVSLGVLSGQIVALELNVRFSGAGVTPKGLGDLKVKSGAFANYKVSDVLTLAKKVLGGQASALPCGVSISTLNAAVTAINENYDNGIVDRGYLVCPTTTSSTSCTTSGTTSGSTCTTTGYNSKCSVPTCSHFGCSHR